MSIALPVRVAVACDHAGLELKQLAARLLAERGYEVDDLGTHTTDSCDYGDYAHKLASSVASGTHAFGVLVCGTGVGMSMAANRHPGVRAALCAHAFTARMTREHNDANVLCLGARVIGVGVAEEIIAAFFETKFAGGRHQTRVQKIERPA